MNKQWTKGVTISALILLMAADILWPVSAAREQEHEKIVEKVTVTNVEVPVRVLYKGEPVTGLTIDDFTLYENKKKMKINGFFEKHKTLSIVRAEAEAAAPKAPPRTFVLVFNVSNYNNYFEEAVNHLFDNILKPEDRLLIFANDKTRQYNNLTEKDKVKAQLVADLKEEGMKAKGRLQQYISRVETYLKVDDFRRMFTGRFGKTEAEEAIEFLKKYSLTWSEYQQTYLLPRVEQFYYFSRFLEKVKGQKWVLNFYQFEFFPRIRPGSRTLRKLRDLSSVLTQSEKATNHALGRKLDMMLNQLNTDLLLDRRFPNEQVTKLFYKVDATFHSFFIKSSNSAFLQDIEYNEVSSDVEKILKGITNITGGENITSTNLVQSLETVTKKEDSYYVLTYVPADPKKSGKLKIKVKNKKYKVLYDDNFRVDYINAYFARLGKKIETPDIQIKEFSFKRKILAFTVSEFLMRKMEGKNIGRMKVRIRLTNANNKKLFDSSKLLTAQKNVMTISLPVFKNIKKGEYNFLIDAVDIFTGKEANFHQNIIVKR
jgi:hypothetical protein